MPLHLLALKPSTQRIVCINPQWKDQLPEDWQQTIFAWDTPDQLHEKQGRSIARCELAGQKVFLKRHYVLPTKHGLLARLFPAKAWSPGLQEWQNIEQAKAAGVPTPELIVAGEYRGPGLQLRSFLAVKELENQLALHEAIPLAFAQLDKPTFARWKRNLIRELALICQRMHKAGLFHRDLYLCHFFVRIDDIHHAPATFQNRLTVIDFHRFGKANTLSLLAQAKDLAQFLFSTWDTLGLTARDRLRFWKYYRSETNSRILRWLTLWKVKTYVRHNRKHVLTVPRKEPI